MGRSRAGTISRATFFLPLLIALGSSRRDRIIRTLFCRGSFGTLLYTHALRSKIPGCFADTGSLASVYTWPHTHLLLLSFSLIMCCHVRLLLLAVQESRKHLYHSAYVPEKQVQRSTTLPLRAAESLVDDVSSRIGIHLGYA